MTVALSMLYLLVVYLIWIRVERADRDVWR